MALPAAYALHVMLELTAHPDLLSWRMMVLVLCFLPACEGHRLASAAGSGNGSGGPYRGP